MNQIASVLLVPTWRITYVRTERGEKNAQCLKVKFGIIGRGEVALETLGWIVSSPSWVSAPLPGTNLSVCGFVTKLSEWVAWIENRE